MKSKIILGLALILCVLSTAVFAGSAIWVSRPLEGITYKFEVLPGKRDQWNSATHEMPPLSPGKASSTAKNFALSVPLPKDMSEWECKSITLHRVGLVPEQWIYLIHFEPVPKFSWIGPLAELDVPVRFDGTIPKPTITKQ